MTDQNNIVEQINRETARLTPAYRQVADFLAGNPEGFIRQPMRALSETIGISEPTLIRFARHFGFSGFPDLRLAVAMSLAAANTSAAAALEPSLKDKQVVNRTAKRAIAKLAASLLASDRSVLLDSGSTVQFLSEQLTTAPGLTIMTTGLNTLLALKDCQQHELILPGGVVRQNAMSLSGRLVESSLSAMSFDTAYIGADSIHPEHGLSTYSAEEAHLNRAMIKASRRVVVLADASKFKSPHLHCICALSGVDIIVSDISLSDEMTSAVEIKGPRMLLAKPPAAPQSQAKDR